MEYRRCHIHQPHLLFNASARGNLGREPHHQRHQNALIVERLVVPFLSVFEKLVAMVGRHHRQCIAPFAQIVEKIKYFPEIVVGVANLAVVKSGNVL